VKTGFCLTGMVLYTIIAIITGLSNVEPDLIKPFRFHPLDVNINSEFTQRDPAVIHRTANALMECHMIHLVKLAWHMMKRTMRATGLIFSWMFATLNRSLASDAPTQLSQIPLHTNSGHILVLPSKEIVII
jgi:hypothetical protein